MKRAVEAAGRSSTDEAGKQNLLRGIVDRAGRGAAALATQQLKVRPSGGCRDVDQQYERLRGAAWERLTDTLDRLGTEAAARGLRRTPGWTRSWLMTADRVGGDKERVGANG